MTSSERAVWRRCAFIGCIVLPVVAAMSPAADHVGVYADAPLSATSHAAKHIKPPDTTCDAHEGSSVDSRISYGQLLFKDVYESLDRIVCAIRPTAADIAGHSSLLQEQSSDEKTAFRSDTQRASPSTSSVSQHAVQASQASSSGWSSSLKFLRSPRSVAEIRNQGGFPIAAAMTPDRRRPCVSSSQSASPPPPHSPPPPPLRSSEESTNDDSEACRPLPLATPDRSSAITGGSTGSYVRGLSEHLLRMAAAKSKHAGQRAAGAVEGWGSSPLFLFQNASLFGDTSIFQNATQQKALANAVLQGTTTGISEARRLLLGTGVKNKTT